MSNIYSAKFMHEASTTLESKVFKRPVNETYLFSAMNSLREMNNIIDESTKKLYIQISEAESKEDENKIFADYFYQFKNIFSDFANRLQQMKSRMVISIENKVETWEDLYKDDEYISYFDKEFSYSGHKFSHVEDSDYPRLNLHKIYQKEFDYIGQLMQDTSMNASPSVRLKIIASVCNNFAKCSGDKNWIKELIHDMIDIDEKEISRSYSECIYNALRDKYDITVDKGMLYTCKESLSDYEDVIDAASKLCDNLLYDLDKVAENISSYLFRNKDNKLKIKTDTDGVIDRDYRLDTYSMNQLDLFLRNKINQIKKVLNVFSIAVGIKFDTAVDFIDQNIEILKMAKTYDSNKIEDEDTDDEENSDNTDEPTDVEDPNSDKEEPQSDDEESEYDEEEPEDGNDDDFEFGNDDSEDEGEPIEEEPEDDLEDNEDEHSMGNDVVDDDSEDFEEGYLFESELFELEMMQGEYEMHQFISEAVLLEDKVAGQMMQQQQQSQQQSQQQQQQSDTKTADDTNSDNGDNNNLKKLANKANEANIIQKIIEKIKELWERFRKRFFDKTKEKVEYLKKNADFITKHKVTGEASLKYTPKFEKIDQLKIPDFNYATMKDKLVDEDTFCTAYFKDPFYKAKQSESITDSIKVALLGEEQAMGDVTKLQTSVIAAYNYCVGYEKRVNEINSQINMLYKAEKSARQDISRVQESTNNIHNRYFMEFDGSETSKNNEKSNNIKVYFNVCSRVLAAKMTVCVNLFDEMYKYCNWWILRAKGGNTDGQAKQTPPGQN